MKKIRKTNHSIIVLSDDFLKSENCMREIFEFIKDDSYKDRIIPIILDSAKDIWGPGKGMQYTIFWKEREAAFKEQLKLIDEESKGGYIEDLKHISAVKDSIGDIIKIFREMKMFDANEENLAENIVSYLKKRIVPTVDFVVVVVLGVIFLYLLYIIEILKDDGMNRLEVITMSETAYKDAIIRLSNGKIVYDHYNDFDSDGICEMFAIVGEEIDADTIRGEIWFVN